MINKIIYVFFVLSFTSCSVLKPDSYMIKSPHGTALEYINSISSTFLEKHLSVLASDEFEGRETTKKGQKLAAAYLKNFLVEMNIKSAYDSTYFQQFPVDVSDFNNVKLFVNNEQLSFIDQFYSFGNPINKSVSKLDLVDVDYGIISTISDDYEGKDVFGKIALMSQGTKNINDPLSQGNWRTKLKSAEEKGAEAIIIKTEDYKDKDLRIKNYLRNPTMKMHNNRNSKPHIPVFIAAVSYTHLTLPTILLV